MSANAREKGRIAVTSHGIVAASSRLDPMKTPGVKPADIISFTKTRPEVFAIEVIWAEKSIDGQTSASEPIKLFGATLIPFPANSNELDLAVRPHDDDATFTYGIDVVLTPSSLRRPVRAIRGGGGAPAEKGSITVVGGSGTPLPGDPKKKRLVSLRPR